jgi:hypothetical protein
MDKAHLHLSRSPTIIILVEQVEDSGLELVLPDLLDRLEVKEDPEEQEVQEEC